MGTSDFMLKDRKEAGILLGEKILNKLDTQILKNIIILSLVRGGAPIGYEIAKAIKRPHYPLVTTKVEAPGQSELAIGAICDGKVYLNHQYIDKVGFDDKEITYSIARALEKEKIYKKKFGDDFPHIFGKHVIVADDGVATGATIFAACIMIHSKKAKKIYLAVPVAPEDFNPYDLSMFNEKKACFTDAFILKKDVNFYTVGQYYKNFFQLTNEETLSYFL